VATRHDPTFGARRVEGVGSCRVDYRRRFPTQLSVLQEVDSGLSGVGWESDGIITLIDVSSGVADALGHEPKLV
jgi:hypothetical protein